MQNLRDKLLKAGVVSKKDQRRSEHQQRQDQRHGRAEPAQSAEARRQALYEAQLQAQRERDQALEAERRAAREDKERNLRVLYVVEHYATRPKRGKRRFNFMARDGRVEHLFLDEREASMLEYGQNAIVERPGGQGDRAHAIVNRESADLIWSLGDEFVRFYNRPAADARGPRWWEISGDPAVRPA